MERMLYASAFVTIGEYSLPLTDPLWHQVNVIDTGPLAVFPGSCVVIRRLGREPVLANPNHVIYYNLGERYERRLHDTRHHCVFVRFAPSMFAELTGGMREVPFAQGPSSADVYLAHHRVVQHLKGDFEEDALYVEETISHVLARVLGDALELHRIRPRARASTRAMHHELAEAAKILLTEHATERRPLEFFARALHTSEFHLARVFRATTGFSLHGYRTHLRLRLALARLAARDIDLSGLAHRLGYASHSHFTDSFRQVFGVPPSVVRDEFGSRRIRELRRVAEAPL